MIKVDKNVPMVKLKGSPDVLVEELGNAMYAMLESAFDRSDREYIRMCGYLDELYDTVVRMFEDEHDIDFDAIDDEMREETRPVAEAEIQKIRASLNLSEADKKALEKLVRIIFDVKDDGKEKK